jgi:hypothetical protein
MSFSVIHSLNRIRFTTQNKRVLVIINNNPQMNLVSCSWPHVRDKYKFLHCKAFTYKGSCHASIPVANIILSGILL